MTMLNKGLLAFLAAALIGGWLSAWAVAGLKKDLAVQTARAERAEFRAAALEALADYRATQISALWDQAAECEKARSREAADTAERRAILGPAREEERQSAQGGATPPRISEGGSAHDATRRAVADRLNRPL